MTGVTCLSRAVHGLDATAAQTFGTLFNMLESLGVELVITHMENPEMEKLLRAHGVIGSSCCMCVPEPFGLASSRTFSTPSSGHMVSYSQLLHVHTRSHRTCRSCVDPLQGLKGTPAVMGRDCFMCIPAL